MTDTNQHFDFRLASIGRQFRLRALPTLRQGGFYQKLAAYGHVGRRDMALPWEVTDKVEALQEHTPSIFEGGRQDNRAQCCTITRLPGQPAPVSLADGASQSYQKPTIVATSPGSSQT